MTPDGAPPEPSDGGATAEPPPAPGRVRLLGPSRGAAPWAITPSALPLHVLDADPAAGTLVADAAPRPRRGEVAVIRADGIVVPRCHPVFERIGWAVSCESLPARIEAAIGEGAPAVAVLFDSPGGSSAGVAEAAKRIAAAAKAAPVVAVCDYLCASAAYWLAASCSAVAASPSAMVGSVGVYLVRVGVTRLADTAGIDLDVFHAGDGKLDRSPFADLDDAGRDRLQATVDHTYGQFAAAVAAGRGVARSKVQRDWGAHLLDAGPAREAGMVDVVMTARDVTARLSTAAGRRRFRTLAAGPAIVSAIGRRLAAVTEGDPHA